MNLVQFKRVLHIAKPLKINLKSNNEDETNPVSQIRCPSCHLLRSLRRHFSHNPAEASTIAFGLRTTLGAICVALNECP